MPGAKTVKITAAALLIGFFLSVPHPALAQGLDEATALNQQVTQLYKQGRYSEAVPLAQRALTSREKALGPEHPDVAQSLNNLAELYRFQGRYADAEPLYKRALAIDEKAFGPNHPSVALTLNNIAELYGAQGRYADAEPLLKRSLALREKALRPDHPDVAESLNNLAVLYYTQGRYANAESLLKRSLAINEKALGPDHADVATSVNNIAELYRAQGLYAYAEPLYKRSLAIREKALGPDHPDVAGALNNLALLYDNQGRYVEAEPLYKRALAIHEKALGPNHFAVATSLNNLAELYINQGRYADAEPLYKRALGIRKKALGPDHLDVAQSLNNLAFLYDKQGRYVDAEPLYKRALVIREKSLGPNHADVAASLNNLALLFDNQGRYVDAEPLYMRSLAIWEKALGPNHPNVATALNNLAALYDDQGRYADEELLSKRALTIREKALGPDHPDVAQSLNNLALLYHKQGRYADAEPLYKRALAIVEKLHGPDHPDVAQALNNLASLYDKQKRYTDSERLYKRALAIREKALGPNHPDVALSLNNLAGLYRDEGRYADAYASIKQTFAKRSSQKNPSFSIILAAQRSQLLAPEQSFADSFNVLQFTSSSGAAEAVQKLAVRYAAGADELAQLVRHDQNLIAESDRADRALIAAVSKEPKQRNQANEDRMRAHLSEIQGERSQIERVLTEGFPDYVALSRPKPLTLEETQSLLSDDEAVVAIDIGDKSYAWVITKTNADWTEIPASSKTLDDQVTMLRQSLTFTVDKPFDAALAYRIYQETLEPIANRLADKKRITIITNGALTAIPLQLLVTKDPVGKALKDVDWLVKSYAMTVIPSIYSLKTMRAQKSQSIAPKPMIAFADPVFSKTARKEARKFALRSMTSFYSGTQVDIPALAETLPQLPSTRDEVLHIAKTLNVPASDIHLGLDATETAVKKAPLNQYRIIYFATHALVAGDLKAFAQAKAEPALVLTIPDKPTAQDDGLLRMTEISELKLNADWVVLSACNTAASDGVGAEALSGLARAFFYAGARSLIVSHWDVLDEETVQLMSDLFKINSENRSLSHGEALREAQLDILNSAKNDDQAHPRVWAPFVVVGEPMKLQ